MRTERQHQDGGRWNQRPKKSKKIRDGKTDKYTYLRNELRTQSNIHDGPVLQK